MRRPTIGVNYVEAYGPKLPKLYRRPGFETKEKYRFDRKQAAPGWDFRKFDSPSYHIMRLRGGKKKGGKLSPWHLTETALSQFPSTNLTTSQTPVSGMSTGATLQQWPLSGPRSRPRWRPRTPNGPDSTVTSSRTIGMPPCSPSASPSVPRPDRLGLQAFAEEDDRRGVVGEHQGLLVGKAGVIDLPETAEKVGTRRGSGSRRGGIRAQRLEASSGWIPIPRATRLRSASAARGLLQVAGRRTQPALRRPAKFPGSPGRVYGMDTYSLGGFTVHRVGFGAMQLPGPGVIGPPRDHDEAIAVLRRAVDLGVDHIDTAQFYGPDVANELIREALHPYPDDLVLVSKVGAIRDEHGGWLPGQRPAQLRSAVEDNLRSLATDRLGAVNLRLMNDREDPDEQPVPLEDQLAEMVALRDEGKIAGVGISTASRAQVEQAITQADIVCVQNAFSLVCHDSGVAYVPYFPLGSAFPGMPKVTENAAVQAVAQRIGATPAQVGLAWLLARCDNVLLIPGTSSVAHLEENMQVADIALSDADVAELEKGV
jgi:pyridoxine 4-dehydrogenase